MKIGRNIDKVRGALRKAGKYDRAWLVEFAAMPGQTVQKLSEAEGKVTPYFSIIVVHGQGADHERLCPDRGAWPGAEELVTPEVRDALAQATDVVAISRMSRVWRRAPA